MSTTTQILFNSPALHSLKRDQLIKLFKIHSIKANGKNIEIIDRLKQHAQSLPRDSPLSVASRSEDPTMIVSLAEDNNDDDDQNEDNEDEEGKRAAWKSLPRPSEQWVVMESIEEMEESSSQGTLSSLGSRNAVAGEFGTGRSKPTSVGSSIKALATSLGLKRTTSKSTYGASTSSKPTPDELTQHAIPYSSIPPSDPTTLPQTDHFTFTNHGSPSNSNTDPFNFNFDYNDPDSSPIPGHVLRPGIPAPANARLSMGLNPNPSTPTTARTTIRLVSNGIQQQPDTDMTGTPQLKPFETTFDLVLGTPHKLYPDLPWDTMGSPAKDKLARDNDNKEREVDDVKMPGTLSFPTPPPLMTPSRKLAPPPAAPFVFGSPLPQNNLSNQQFKNAAASVLEEMNKRLQEEGVETLGVDLLDKLGKGTRPVVPLPGTISRDKRAEERAKVRDKFEKAHEEEFNKMESIGGWSGKTREPPKRRESGMKRKSMSGSAALGVGGGRRPSAAAARSGAGTRVISNGRRKRMVPGGFEEEDEEEEEEDDKERKDSKRVRLSINTPDVDTTRPQEDKTKEEERKQKERDAIRRKLEMNKARRRSSMGRVSVGGGKAPLIPNKPKGSRFGFLSSAKSIVQSVWNRGGPKDEKPGSSLPKPKAAVLSKPQIPSAPPPKKPSVAPLRPSTARPAPAPATSTSISRLRAPEKGTISSTTSSNRARSPIPTFPASTYSSTRSSKAGSTLGTISSSTRLATRKSSNSIAGASSLGTRTSVSSSALNSRVSSMGSRDAGNTASRIPSLGKGMSSSGSRLLAPTASSLAKMRPSTSHEHMHTHTRVPSLASVAENHASGSSSSNVKSALDQITNTPSGILQSPQPAEGKISSKLLAVTSPSAIPTAIRTNPTITTTGPMSTTDMTMKPPVPLAPKPKVLPGRKPRISRSKVIAKLASQRAASHSSTSIASGSGLVPGAMSPPTGLSGGGRVRSSLGAKRQSYGGVKARKGSATGDVLMSAKKRARQSEYARRRSRIANPNLGPAVANAMDVDD